MNSPFIDSPPYYRIVCHDQFDTSMTFNAISFKAALKHSIPFICNHLNEHDNTGIDLLFHAESGNVVNCLKIVTDTTGGF